MMVKSPEVEYTSLSKGELVRIVFNGMSTPATVIAIEHTTDTLVVHTWHGKKGGTYTCYHLKGKVSPPNSARSQFRRVVDWLCNWK
jgi:hypothetical protein